MKVKVINGANLNMLGIREPQIYGAGTYDDLTRKIKMFANESGVEVSVFQSNHEGAIVDEIHKAYFEKFDAVIINPGAYTHSSIAILDALKAVNIPTVEVHLSDISKREEWRKHSYVSLYAEKVICGKGFDGYIEALLYLLDKNW